MKEILEVRVTWASAGSTVPAGWFEDCSWQRPDFFNDSQVQATAIPDLVNGNGDPLRVEKVFDNSGQCIGGTTISDSSKPALTWETLTSDEAHFAYAKLKEDWVSIDIIAIVPSHGFLFYERDNLGAGQMFENVLDGWEDEILALAKKMAEPHEQSVVLTLLVELKAGDSHYDNWSGASEHDDPQIVSIGVLNYGKLESIPGHEVGQVIAVIGPDWM